MYDKTVTIIGAGPAGLTLARLLQMRGVSVRIFENDASFTARDQGGTFDVHDDGGQKALIEAQLIDEFNKFARPEGQTMKIIDKHGTIQWNDEGRPDGDMSRPEIDRQVLRNILLNSLEPGTVIWNKHVAHIDSLGVAQHKIVFRDGTSDIADFVVGADGTWSKVRPLLSSVEPIYTGVLFVESRITKPDVTSPKISELVGHGGAFVLGENKGLMAQRNGDDTIRIYVALRVPEYWPNDYDFSRASEIRSMLLDVLSGWQSEMLEMLVHTDDNFVPRHIFTLPLEQNWKTKDGITIIGDAAHVMTPFAGQGANLAMLDALQLADCFTSSESENVAALTEKIKSFEEMMISRARLFSEESFNNLNAFITEHAPRQVVEIFKSHHGPEEVE